MRVVREEGVIMKRIVVLVLAAAATPAAWAGSPWEDTPASQWTMADTTQILTDSPWVQEAHVPAPWIKGEPQVLFPMLGGCEGRLDPNERPHPYSGSGFQSVVVYRVSWVSAKAYREAKARRAVLCKEIEQDDADTFVEQNGSDDYLIFVQSPDMTPFEGSDADTIAKGAMLSGKKSGRSVHPSSVDVQNAGRTRVFGVVFHFPKNTADGQPTVAPDENQLTFDYKAGKSEVRVRFRPKDMTLGDASGL
jgi:hypothetical protein